MVTLYRVRKTESEVCGVWCLEGLPLCFTLELPWRDNHPNESCVPDGSYRLVRVVSTQHGETVCITNVPNRTGILVHCGNKCLDTKGCVLVGGEFSEVPSHGVVLFDSRKTFDIITPQLLKVVPCDIQIVNL